MSQSRTSTPTNLKASKTTPCRSTGITKTLLTPCRRLGLSRKFKASPTQSSPNTSLALTPPSSSVPIAVVKPQESPITINSPKQSEKLVEKQSVKTKLRFRTADVKKPINDNCGADKKGCNSLADGTVINSPKQSEKLVEKQSVKTKLRFRTADVKKPINDNCGADKKGCNSLADGTVINSPKQSEKLVEKKVVNSKSRSRTTDVKEPISDNCEADKKGCSNLPDTNDRNQDGNKAKCSKVAQKKIKPVPSGNLKDDQSEANTPCVKTSLSGKGKNIQSELASVSKKKFKRCLSLKKSSSSLDELTDTSDLLSPQKSTSSLLSSEFLRECNVDVESDEELKVPRKRRCVVYSSDEDDFVPSQNSVKKQNNGSQQLQDEDWYLKVVEIKKRIKEKEVRLAELKRAEVYKRLHNVQELNKCAKMWKKCLEEGLIDLLPKLQEHGQIDMPTLINKFNVSKNVVYNVNTESFM